MIGNVDSALRALLAEALPDLFGGAPPKVQLKVTSEALVLDPSSMEAIAGEPRPDERVDLLPFDAAKPQGPYTLTQPPCEGPRRVRLRTRKGDALWLKDSEVTWDPAQPRVFQLALRPERDPAGVAGVEAVYQVMSVFTTLKAGQTLGLELDGTDADALERARALLIAVVALNRQRLIDQARKAYATPSYGASVELKTLRLVSANVAGTAPPQLTLSAELEIKATRALADGEGTAIQRANIAIGVE